MTLAQFDALPDSERSLWVARWERARLTCNECGNPIEECSDPQRAWYPFRRVCYATMAREAFQAQYERLHEKRPWHNMSFTSWSEKPNRSHPAHMMAGVTIGVTSEEVAPWDDFTTNPTASPDPPSDESGVAED